MARKKAKEKRRVPNVPWDKFLDGEIPPKDLNPEAIRSRILFIALDTEYQSNYTANTNLCLSYQYAAYDLFEGSYKSGIFYPDIHKEERFTLSEFTKKVLHEINMPISKLKDYRIIYVAHFFTAEWAMFKNRKELHMKFEFIRKSMITTNRSLSTTIIDENGKTVNLWADVRDTMLLLPENYKSLEKASTFIEGYEKIDISTEYKSNMYQFMQDEPELFEQYAIRDVEVTLKLFIKLQYMLNKINGSTNKLFSTLASATTNDFRNFSKNKFQDIRLQDVSHALDLTNEDEKSEEAGKLIHNMQFDRWHSLYREYESLANRSYLGGLNSSYHIGKAEGYTFVDIDFKNCYPTALNLLKIGDFGEKVDKPEKYKASAIDLEGIENA